MGRRNIRKIRQANTPIPPQASFASARLANADGESNNNSDSDKDSGKDNGKDNGKKTPWWNIADSIADTVVKIYDGVVDPILFGGGKYTGEVSIRQEKDNTAKYLIIGGVIIVALVLIMKYVKK